jgi:prevent-host-death family protein
MSTHTIAEAEGRLAELIDRALDGEGVVIVRDGEPVVELTPVNRQSKKAPGPQWTPEQHLEWLRSHRARLTPAKTDAVTLIRTLRDEEWG